MNARKVLHTFLSRVIGVVASVVTVVITSRFFGAEWRGELSLFLTWSGAWILLSDIVSGSALINLSTQYSVRNLFRIAFRWVLIVTMLLALSTLFWNYQLRNSLHWLLIPMLLFMGFFNLNGALLIGKGFLVLRNYLFAAIPLLGLSFLLIVILFFDDIAHFSVNQYVLIVIGSWCLVGLVLYFRLRRISKESDLHQSKRLDLKKLGSAGLQSQLGHIVQFALARGPFILLPVLFTKELLGVFSNTVLLSESVLLIASSLGQVLHAQLVHAENNEKSMETCFRFARMSTLLTFFPLIGLLILPENFWEFLLQKEFGGMKQLLFWYVPVVLLQAVSSIFSHFFHAMGRFGVLIKANGMGAVVAWIGMFLFSKWGAESGFVFGVVSGYLIQLLVLLWEVMRNYRFHWIWLLPGKQDGKLLASFISKRRF